jgi:hypothetical protein
MAYAVWGRARDIAHGVVRIIGRVVCAASSKLLRTILASKGEKRQHVADG